jgi:hypothetical protein
VKAARHKNTYTRISLQSFSLTTTIIDTQ